MEPETPACELHHLLREADTEPPELQQGEGQGRASVPIVLVLLRWHSCTHVCPSQMFRPCASQVIAKRALACAPGFNCQSTCNMLWSLATGGSRPRGALLDALAARFQSLLGDASAQQMGARMRATERLIMLYTGQEVKATS